MHITIPDRSLTRTYSMGLIALLRRWFREQPPKRPPQEYHPAPRGQDEDEEIAELLAIDII